jgi:outer membrane protein OmpA-like peptidoglycan-associated protein
MQGKTMAIALTVLSGLRACWGKSLIIVNSIIQNTRSILKGISRLGAFKKWGHINAVKMIFSRLFKAFINLFMLFSSIISNTYIYLFNLLKKFTKVKLKPSFSVSGIFHSLKNLFTSIQLNSLNPKSMILGASNYFSSHKKILIIVIAIIAGLITSVMMLEKPAEGPKFQSNDELLVQSSITADDIKDHVLFSKNFGFNQNKIDLKSDLEAIKIVEKINSENKPIQIIGYADARGSRLYNLNLAHNRAMEAYKSLISIGLEAYLVDSIHASSPLESATCLEDQCLDFMKFEIIQRK